MNKNDRRVIRISTQWHHEWRKTILEQRADDIGRYISGAFRVSDGLERTATRIGLKPADLRAFVSAHVVMDSAFSSGIEGLIQQAQTMPTKLVLEPELLEGEIRGHVDWVQTVQHRAHTGNQLLYLCHPPSRSKDTFLSRAMFLLARSMLETLDSVISIIGNHPHSDGSLSHTAMTCHEKLIKIVGTGVFNGITKIETISSRGIEDLYKLPGRASEIADALRLMQDGNQIKDEEHLCNVIKDVVLTYAEPSDVFELVVGTEIIRSLNESGFVTVSTALSPTGLLMNFVRGDETEIELWAQKSLKNAIKKSTIVPESVSPPTSRYSEFRKAAGYGAASLEPDHLLIMRQGEYVRILMIEEKLYRNHTSGVRAGLKGAMANILDSQKWLDENVQQGPYALAVAQGDPETSQEVQGIEDIMICNENGIKDAIIAWIDSDEIN